MNHVVPIAERLLIAISDDDSTELEAELERVRRSVPPEQSRPSQGFSEVPDP
ncbi:MAG: hypothetical protein HOW73_24195 [Polyangiaceae bacterium]|nr:hypothetical protein [Polyangiaceae bacterium]